MENVIEMTAEEIQREMYENNNMEVINGVISGKVKTKQDVAQQTVMNETNQNVVETTPDVEGVPTVEKADADEIERVRRHNEFLKQQQEELKEKEAKERLRILEEAAKEKKRREELEEELQRLKEEKERQASTPVQNTIDEDEEYASDYSRRTRQELEELKKQIGSKDPRLDAIIEKFEKREAEERLIAEEKEQKRTERKLFDEIESLQTNRPELKTDKEIATIHKEYLSFIDELGAALNTKSHVQISKAVEDYYNNGDTKKIVEKYGLNPPTLNDYNNYKIVVDLIDLKRGVEFNPYTGKEEPILDDEGKQIRYRSLDEAYRVSHFYEERNKAKIQAHKEIQQKLASLNNGPVVMSGNEAASPVEVDSFDRDRELISMHPRQYENNPQLKEAVFKAYAKLGVKPPEYRGRKF